MEHIQMILMGPKYQQNCAFSFMGGNTFKHTSKTEQLSRDKHVCFLSFYRVIKSICTFKVVKHDGLGNWSHFRNHNYHCSRRIMCFTSYCHLFLAKLLTITIYCGLFTYMCAFMRGFMYLYLCVKVYVNETKAMHIRAARYFTMDCSMIHD